MSKQITVKPDYSSYSRPELIERVEALHGECERYKNRLKDLVKAHKVVLKEKEGLEEIVKSLSQSSNELTVQPVVTNVALQTTESSRSTPIPPELTEQSTNSEEPPQSAESSASASSSRPATLPGSDKSRDQLLKLIAALTEEKARAHEAFVSDKKAVKIEFENKLSQLQQSLDSKSALYEKLALQIAELKGKYGQLEIEYEHRQVEYSRVQNELQTALVQERTQCEVVNEHLAEVDSKQKQRVHELETRLEAAEARAREQQEALASARREADSANEYVRRAQAELDAARSSRSELSAQFAERDASAELTLKECYRAHETRAAQLEQRLAELSNSVGLNEKLRSADQERIARLKSRMAELEQENAELLRAAEHRLTGGAARKAGAGAARSKQVNSRVLTYTGLLLCVRDALERYQPGEALSPASPTAASDLHSLSSASAATSRVSEGLRAVARGALETFYAGLVGSETDAEKAAVGSELEQLLVCLARVCIGQRDADAPQLHARCRVELEALRDEFEKHKLRAHALLSKAGLLTTISSSSYSSTPASAIAAGTAGGGSAESLGITSLAELTLSGREVERLRTTIADLQLKLREARDKCILLESEAIAKAKEYKENLLKIEERQQQDLTAILAKHKQQMQNSEDEMLRTRQRTLSLLAEKDAELDALRVQCRQLADLQLSFNNPSPTSLSAVALGLESSPRLLRGMSTSSAASVGVGPASLEAAATDAAAALAGLQPHHKLSTGSAGAPFGAFTQTLPGVPEGLREGSPGLSSALTSSPTTQFPPFSSGASLFALQEREAPLQAEISRLRREKQELNAEVRRLQSDLAALRTAHDSERRELRERVAQLEGSARRASELSKSQNFEYLKNVLFRFLTTADAGARRQMLSAIALIVQFSPAERRAIDHFLRDGKLPAGFKPVSTTI